MDLKEINELCYRIMSFYDYNLRCNKAVNDELYSKLNEEYLNNLLIANDNINAKTVKKLKKDYNTYQDIFNYCFVFKEELMSNDLLIEILKNNYVKLCFSILQMNKDLNDEIIKLILNTINNDRNYVGKMPYDYRYHILKREEISDDIKQDLLISYNKDELENIVEEIGFDLEDEFTLNKIQNISDLKKNNDLYREYIAYNIMRRYLNQKVYKK